MEYTESSIVIDAPPQAVWSVLDDLESYPEWNPIVPRLSGRTTVGEMVEGELVIPQMPTPPLAPTITRIVPGRELRWLSVIPGDEGFSAEHIFILEPFEGGTRLLHREEFDGPAAPMLREPIKHLVGPAYREFDRQLKERVELLGGAAPHLHPVLSAEKISPANHARLRCACAADPVEVELTEAISHNHLCGCSQCWRPDGALFALTAVVPADAARVVANEDRLTVVDRTKAIQRQACSACGVHMIGTVADAEHHFFGLTFVHPERAGEPIAGLPEFAGFVSSLIEGGTRSTAMSAIRAELADKNIPAFDAFSPEIMDLIAYHMVKIERTDSNPSSGDN